MPLEDLFGLLIPLTYLLMLLGEQFFSKYLHTSLSGRHFPSISWWKITGAAFVMMIMSFNIVLPLFLPTGWIREHSLFDGSQLGLPAGVLIGYLLNSLVQYGIHRLEHRSPFLWRTLHQLHHSPQRVDISGAAFTHPNEMVLMVLVSIICNIFILGLDPLTVAIVGFVSAFYSIFQHWNISTPHWLGYIIERPEAHCLHHDRDDIRYNYSDLPLWDIAFGTFKNPESKNTNELSRVGFTTDKAKQIIPMLLGQDVHQPNPTR